MLTAEFLLIFYCALIVFSSMLGGRLPKLMRMTHLRTQMLMSSVGGLMLGIGMLHLLPHATELLGSSARSGTAALGGLIGMFLLIRLFHTHDHGVDETASHASGCGHHHHSEAPTATATDASSLPVPQHMHADPDACGCGDEHAHDVTHDHRRGIGWLGMFFGLAMHTLIDGVALGSSVLADSHHQVWLGLAGVGTFLAVVLHKPLDAFAITSVMRQQGWSTVAQNLANVFFSMACPIGAAMVYFGVQSFAGGSELLGWGLAISAGFFICIALADLLPEVAFHNHDRGKLTAALLTGVLLAVAIENLPGHEHDHTEIPSGQPDTHDHQGHDHD